MGFIPLNSVNLTGGGGFVKESKEHIMRGYKPTKSSRKQDDRFCAVKHLVKESDMKNLKLGSAYPPKVRYHLIKLFPKKEASVTKGVVLTRVHMNQWNLSTLKTLRKSYPLTQCKKQTDMVYVLEAGLTSKVGVTNNIKMRLATLQNGNAYKIRLGALYKFESEQSARFVEKETFLEFSDQRAVGEWFHESADSIIKHLDSVCESRRSAERLV